MEADQPNMSSNIFLIKGMADTVWIFGTGYGDGNIDCDHCNDYTFYRGKDFHTAQNAIDDARLVDSIITKAMGLEKEKVILEIIAPHFHADHLNAEFVTALFDSLGYSWPAAPNIFVHANDFTGAICNEPCCGTEPCPDKENPYYAAPYQPAWTASQLSQIISIGNPGDTCNQTIQHLTSVCGDWVIIKGMNKRDGGHTDGTINLFNQGLRLRIAGTLNNPQCQAMDETSTLYVHGNSDWTSDQGKHSK